MSCPPLVRLTGGNSGPSKVIIVPAADPCHYRLEPGQFILQVFHGVVQDIQFRGLLPNYLREVIGLRTRLD